MEANKGGQQQTHASVDHGVLGLRQPDPFVATLPHSSEESVRQGPMSTFQHGGIQWSKWTTDRHLMLDIPGWHLDAWEHCRVEQMKRTRAAVCARAVVSVDVSENATPGAEHLSQPVLPTRVDSDAQARGYTTPRRALIPVKKW